MLMSLGFSKLFALLSLASLCLTFTNLYTFSCSFSLRLCLLVFFLLLLLRFRMRLFTLGAIISLVLSLPPEEQLFSLNDLLGGLPSAVRRLVLLVEVRVSLEHDESLGRVDAHVLSERTGVQELLTTGVTRI